MFAKTRAPRGEAMLALLRSDILPKALTKPGPQTWEELHRMLREQGLELRLRGAGLVFQNAGGTVRVKASSVGRELSLKALTDKLGPYKASTGADEAVSRSPAVELAARTFTSVTLLNVRRRRAQNKQKRPWKRSNSSRRPMCARRERSRKTARSPMSASAPRTASSGKDGRLPSTPCGSNFDQIPQKAAGASFPSWPAYVRSQAALGDAEAIASSSALAHALAKAKSKPFSECSFRSGAPRCEAARPSLV